MRSLFISLFFVFFCLWINRPVLRHVRAYPLSSTSSKNLLTEKIWSRCWRSLALFFIECCMSIFSNSPTAVLVSLLHVALHMGGFVMLVQPSVSQSLFWPFSESIHQSISHLISQSVNWSGNQGSDCIVPDSSVCIRTIHVHCSLYMWAELDAFPTCRQEQYCVELLSFCRFQVVWWPSVISVNTDDVWKNSRSVVAFSNTTVTQQQIQLQEGHKMTSKLHRWEGQHMTA